MLCSDFFYFSNFTFLPFCPSNQQITKGGNIKRILLCALSLLMDSVGYAEDISIRYNGSSAKVKQTATDSVKVTVDGARVSIESLYKDHKLTLLLKGKSDDGQLLLKAAGKAKIKLDGLNLTSREGAPLDLKNKKKVEVAAAKGIASKGKITINSGNVTVRTTSAGAEGIEGKQGIVFNGGNVDALSPDDAINANATIEFNDAHVIARSTGNDAVDSNPEGGFFMTFGGNNQDMDPAIVIGGGTVYA